jgi:hypothetical protein
MVISWIQGGIGNQMFQYAAGRALSLLSGQPLYLDLQDYKKYTLHHGYQLDTIFNLDVEIADVKVLNSVLGFRNQFLIKKLIKRPFFKFMRGSRFVIEPHFQYWPKIKSFSMDVYMHGYWQSEKYFQEVNDIIRADFQFHRPLDAKNALLINEVQGNSSVSVHIRRGDYLSDIKTSKIMNVCSLEYYQNALSFMCSRVVDPTFYIFSDDIEWAKANLALPSKSFFVDHNVGIDSYKDMQLMSGCKHHIIANSSFSWWGAWLSANADKLVIAPRTWFVNHHSDRDLIPEKWVRL